MSNVAVNISAEFTGKPAFEKAAGATKKLDNQVSKLAKRMLGLFAVSRVTAFGKAAVKAFAEDETAAARLAKVVDNLGLSFANTDITRFISTLERQSGIVDGELRPAYQALLTTTGDYVKSQQLLNKAIEISRGSGVALGTVTQDLSNAYVGITKGLKKYNLGLTAAQLKTMKFDEVMMRFNKNFDGSSQAFLATYAGQLSILTVAADNAKETIGKGLIDALVLVGGKDTDVTDVADAMQKLADNTANATRGVGFLAGKLNGLSGGFLGDLLNKFGTFGEYTLLGQISQLGQQTTVKKTQQGAANFLYDQGAASRRMAQDKAKAQADKRAADLAKAQLKATKALTAEQKKQALLKKASTMFDMDQANIIAGLKKNISEDERRRLELQLALLTGNADEASRLTKELAIAQGLGIHLANYLASLPDAKNPFASWAAYLDAIQAKVNSISGQSSMYDITPATNVESNYGGAFTDAVRGIGQYSEPVKVKVEFTGGDELTSVIARQLQQGSLSGGNQTYINRRTGGFE